MYFEAVAAAAGATPVVLYNIPSRTVVNLPPAFLAELAAEIDNVVEFEELAKGREDAPTAVALLD